LAFDLRPIEAEASHAMMRGQRIMLNATTAAMIVAMIVTLFGLTVSVFLSRRLLQPLNDLAADAAAIAQGNLEQPVRVVDSEDEIGFLARQFERMRQSIQTYVGELVTARQAAEEATREEQRLRAQIEEHSKLLEIKVQERTAELQEINERLTEYDRMKSEFLSNVSHELRSPLAAIASAAKIIGRYGDENKKTGKKFSAVITDEADRLGRLINDLLDLAKIEAGRVEWNMTRMENPVELLSHVVLTFRPLAEERGIELELDAPERLAAVQLDRDRMLQVLTNLCSNAMKFTPEGGRVVVSARETLYQGIPSLMVAVQDTGPGIPEDQLEKVFDRFHQVKAKRDGNKPKGTGLGLAICREVVNHHGGAIWAEAPPEGGARMVFCLPLADAGRPATADSREPLATTPHEAV
ncbi:MAG: sensor histidine kinase, partial [Candidatus Dadabacteria bacterium]